MTEEKSDVDVMESQNPMLQILKSQIVISNPCQFLRSQFATFNLGEMQTEQMTTSLEGRV